MTKHLAACWLRLFFHHLYHGLALTYDTVAIVVSLGRWNDWVRTVLPLLKGSRILELGFGPGHLQLALRARGFGVVVGLDESAQMAKIAARRLAYEDRGSPHLTRGLAERLPFLGGVFDSVVATFPAEFIFDSQTLTEIRRVLSPGGRLVIVPAAWTTGKNLPERGAAWLFRVTGQAPASPEAYFERRLRGPLDLAGFRYEARVLESGGSLVLVVVALSRS